MEKFNWCRTHPNGYECSSKGDRRFSAFYARLPDGRTIEEAYQCGVKGYPSVKEGKGNPSLRNHSENDLYLAYLKLWWEWAREHMDDLRDLYRQCKKQDTHILTDMFAKTPVNQARALAEILTTLIKQKAEKPL